MCFALCLMCFVLLATPPSLSAELTQYVEESNGSFLKELVEYDRTIQAASHVRHLSL